MEDRIQCFHPVSFVEQIVHQDHRPIEGMNGPHLIRDGRIHRIFFDGEAVQRRRKHLFRVKGLGDRIRHCHASQDLAERHAHALAQLPYF